MAKNNSGNRFFNFLIFFSIFFVIFLPGSCMNGIRVLIFFLSFSYYLIPFWLKIMPERGFLIFWFLLYFFWNFLGRVEYEWNSGLKFFSLFLHLSHPILAKNNAGKGFLIFLQFILEFSCPGRVWMEVLTKIFFSLSLPISSHFG